MSELFVSLNLLDKGKFDPSDLKKKYSNFVKELEIKLGLQEGELSIKKTIIIKLIMNIKRKLDELINLYPQLKQRTFFGNKLPS